MPLPQGVPTSPAQLCLLSSLPPAHSTQPPRVRLVGRVIAYDPEHALALLADGPHGVVVDLSLVLFHQGPAAPRPKDRLMLTGELVLREAPLPLPEVDSSLPPTSTTSPEVDPRVVLVAERSQQCEELDMERWREAVRAVREHGALARGD
ncbi:hypothetical protein DMC30DRAFT_413194 [Rhodotorula diobovata]|uniref:CST complex subunit Stn1 N-terminal domain-containing protein n=1 Tax=Rhodotorula diobovata TaxID=5288 RepID=A0A5C5G647_9BASI|nr:hypothetical protein DMC30DRAFT_413194 [Rhodotorula diobovata]